MLTNRIMSYAALALFCYGSHHVQADTITYGDFESNALFFDDVNETANEAIFPLFGAPTMDGNSLVFSNPGFVATVGEDTLDLIDGRLGVRISAKSGKQIYGFELSEFGSFETTGSDADVFVGAVAFATAGGTVYSADFEHLESGIGEGDWTGRLLVRFDQPVQSFVFTVGNQLFARAGAGSTASIQKNGIRLAVTVPEPASAAILMGPLAAVGLTWRRRSA